MPTQNPMTVDELIASLRHTDLPTIIVEGKEDMPIYRFVETRLGIDTADVLEVGGRKKLLSIFMRRKEFPDLPVAFVADKDMFLFSGIPSDYDEIIWTEGYSIENDLYAGAELEKLLEPEERTEYQQLLDSIVEWFAFEVERHLEGEDFEVAHHCNRVVPPGQKHVDDNFRKDRGFRPPSEEIHQQIRKGYQLQLRGKQLFQALERCLNAPHRDTRYNISSLREIAVKLPESHPLMSRLIQEIERTIADQKTAL